MTLTIELPDEKSEQLSALARQRSITLEELVASSAVALVAEPGTTREERIAAARRVVAVHPAFTSQTCSGCGSIVRKPLSERTHRCLVCDLVLDRDTNAAVNIRAVGQYSLAHV